MSPKFWFKFHLIVLIISLYIFIRSIIEGYFLGILTGAALMFFSIEEAFKNIS